MNKEAIQACMELAETAYGDQAIMQLAAINPSWMAIEYPEAMGFFMKLQLAAMQADKVGPKLRERILSMAKGTPGWFGGDTVAGIERAYGIAWEIITPTQALLILCDMRTLLYKSTSYKHLSNKYLRSK